MKTPSPFHALSLSDPFTATDRFPLAGAYRAILPTTTAPLREPSPALRDPLSDAFTERHLHCVWFDEHLRPETLTTARGESLHVIRPGQWNFEAGPDFLDAEWRIGGRRIRGDVEIHIRPMDWQHHGHSTDPRYRDVRLHVTYEPGTLPQGTLPSDCEETHLKDALDARSHFFFDSFDPTAYPWEVEGGLSSLRALCRDMEEQDRGRLLDAAGQERLRRKTLRMARAVQAVGPTEALYQAIMRALGYKHNAEPCEQLARNLPLHELRQLTTGDPEAAYALFLGVADLLPHDTDTLHLPPWTDETHLWRIWWRQREGFSGRELHREHWRLDATRPGNHPHRRLRAAAALFTQSQPLADEIQPRDDETDRAWVRRCRAMLQVREPSPPGPGGRPPPRLVGPERAAAILVNALVPWRAVTRPEEMRMDLLQALPPEAGNSVTRRAAHALFGPDHHPRLWRGTLRKQGLLQFHEDFGL